jgi:biofilm PGA synthesis N-glycosyltransferase PgaC
MSAPEAYAVITPARDEAAHLPRLASSLAAQTIRPSIWIVVENGSKDDTIAVARRLASGVDWMRVVSCEPASQAARGAPVVHAFHMGLAALDVEVDGLAKVDADVSFGDDYFERLLHAFGRDPDLGLASGTCYELLTDSAKERPVTGDHVWGAARIYRWSCLQDVLPLEERMGWDGIDVVKAQTHGWRTATFRELPFHHHRLEGARDGSRWSAWAAQGHAARFMRYRPSYLVLRSLHRAIREPAALAILWGYLSSASRGEPRCNDADVVARVRAAQRVRVLPARAREALGL